MVNSLRKFHYLDHCINWNFKDVTLVVENHGDIVDQAKTKVLVGSPHDFLSNWNQSH